MPLIMEISAIIPTFNRAEILETNLNHLLKFKEIKEVLVIDDGSTDNTQKIVKKFSSRIPIKYIKNKKNLGSAKCWNIGIKKASREFTILLNDDTYIIQENFFDFIKEDAAKADIIGPRVQNTLYEKKINLIYKIKKSLFGVLFGDPHLPWSKKPSFARFVSGIMFSKTEIMKNLLFDELFDGNCFREESDFQKRARIAGYSIIYDPRIYVLHDQREFGGQRRFSKQEDRKWRYVNHIRFLQKNYPVAKIFWIPIFKLIYRI